MTDERRDWFVDLFAETEAFNATIQAKIDEFKGDKAAYLKWLEDEVAKAKAKNAMISRAIGARYTITYKGRVYGARNTGPMFKDKVKVEAAGSDGSWIGGYEKVEIPKGAVPPYAVFTFVGDSIMHVEFEDNGEVTLTPVDSVEDQREPEE